METERQAAPSVLDELRREFPGASDGILFCVHKLRSDPNLTIPDFRDEAATYGIKLGGRALHSARVLLGLAQPVARRSTPSAAPEPSRRARSAQRNNGNELESRLIATMTEIQEQATEDSRRLRAAIEEAIGILKAALKS